MPTLIAVHACRPGTGKSSLMANLAVAIAHQGRRVGVLDAVSQTSCLPALFGLNGHPPDEGWNNDLRSPIFPHNLQIEISPLRQIEPGTVAILSPALNRAPATESTQNFRHELLQNLTLNDLHQNLLDLSDRLQLDYLLIDTPPGSDKASLSWLAIAHWLLPVLRLSPQDYQETAVLLDLAEQLHLSRIFLLANQVSAEYNLDLVREQLEITYHCAMAGAIPFAKELLTFANQGIFYQRNPTHAWSLAVEAIAKQLTSANSERLTPKLSLSK